MSAKKQGGARKKSSSRRQPEDSLLSSLLPQHAIEGFLNQFFSAGAQGESAVDAAQEIMYEAFEATSVKRQISLARKALQISADCADAYILLAEYAPTVRERLELYEQGVAAGMRALGEAAFEEYDGHFWGVLETRPYMRARAGLADSLWASGSRDEAADHCRELLRLNPNDNQGIRYRLASMLLDLEQHDELEKLLHQYEEDSSAEWAYAWALLTFRQEGDSAGARRRLADAEQANRHVPAYLSGVRPLPPETPDFYAPGDESEAVCCAAQFLPAWKETPGAIAWLRRSAKISPITREKNRPLSWAKVRPSLAQLPQNKAETWLIEIRGIVLPPGEDDLAQPNWMLVIINASDGRVIQLEPFADRPRDNEVLSILIDALRAPQFDAPHRPGEIGLSRKTWFRSWKAKLEEIGIQCRLHDSLEQIDRFMQDAGPKLAAAQQMVIAGSTTDLDWSQALTLPQRKDEVWQLGMKQLAAWVQIAGEPVRPWIRLVAELESSAILAMDISPTEPNDDWLLQGLWQAMNFPAVGQPRRPGVIHVASDQQREMLSARLEPVGIQCVASTNQSHICRLLHEVSEHLAGDQSQKALVNSPGITPAVVGKLFAAAADYYRARPWRSIAGDSIIRVDCDQFDNGPWYAVVMGQSGVERGLALYDDLNSLRAIMSGELSQEESGNRTSAISVTYGEAFELAPRDLEAAEERHWPVAGPEAFPSVMRVEPGMAIRSPLRCELELLTGCLHVIPKYIGQHAVNGEFSVVVADDTLTFKLEQPDDAMPRRAR